MLPLWGILGQPRSGYQVVVHLLGKGKMIPDVAPSHSSGL